MASSLKLLPFYALLSKKKTRKLVLMYQSIPKPPIPTLPPPSGQTTFSKNFGQIPRCVGSLDGQVPHRLGLHRASNSPPFLYSKYNIINSNNTTKMPMISFARCSLKNMLFAKGFLKGSTLLIKHLKILF